MVQRKTKLSKIKEGKLWERKWISKMTLEISLLRESLSKMFLDTHLRCTSIPRLMVTSTRASVLQGPKVLNLRLAKRIKARARKLYYINMACLIAGLVSLPVENFRLVSGLSMRAMSCGWTTTEATTTARSIKESRLLNWMKINWRIIMTTPSRN